MNHLPLVILCIVLLVCITNTIVYVWSAWRISRLRKARALPDVTRHVG